MVSEDTPILSAIKGRNFMEMYCGAWVEFLNILYVFRGFFSFITGWKGGGVIIDYVLR